MRRRLFSPGRVRFRRLGGRNHFTKPGVEGLESRWLLAGDVALAQAYGQLPMSFEVNQGQTDPQVDFLSRGSGYALFLTPTESVLSLQAPTPTPPAPGAAAAPVATDAVLSMQLVGASATPQVVGLDQLPGTSNYFIGNDPSQWHTDIPSYAQVEEQGVFPGVDLVYYGNQQQLEYNFTVAPGADPGVIRLAFTGAQSATLDNQGNLVLQTAGGAVVEDAPVLYQEAGGVRQTVSGQYVLEGNGQVGFAVGSFDRSQPLVIDPTLSYSTYLGGTNSDSGSGIAVDAAGNAYVTGYTDSTNFPTANPLKATYRGNEDAFVAKLNPAGSALVYSTYLGGSGEDEGNGIAVDSAGNAYVTGLTESPNFPTANPLQATFSGDDDAFVAKLNPAGSALVYSTYLGGGGDEGYGIAADTAGNAYVTGRTHSPNFPTANPLQATLGGGDDAFVAKLNPAGSALVYSTYLGGSGNDGGTGIAVDSAGNAYVTGVTTSPNFPTANALQATLGGSGAENAFVAKLNPAGLALVYSTYLGGSGQDEGAGIAVDTAGNDYVTGTTTSPNFPTANPLQATLGSVHGDAFVAKLNPAGSALVYSTYLGGSVADQGDGIALDTAGNAYVTGLTESADFPTANPLQATFGGGLDDAFVAKLNPAGSALVYSTFLGGSSYDSGAGIAVDSAGAAYVTGYTVSTNFPTANPLQASLGGGSQDAFVAKLAPVQASSTTTVTSAPDNPSFYGQSVTFTATVAGNPPGAGIPTGTVQFQIDGTNFGSAVTLVNGSATSNAIATLSAAAHTIQAFYSGDISFMASYGTLSGGQTVNADATGTTMSSSANPSSSGQAVIFTATVANTSSNGSGTPTGSVQFVIDGTNFGAAVTLVNGSASSSAINTLTLGNHVITAVYTPAGGDFVTSTGTLSGGQTVTQPGSWSAIAPLPTARVYLGAATGKDGTIYAVGGFQEGDVPSAEVDAYNPSTNIWTHGFAPHRPRSISRCRRQRTYLRHRREPGRHSSFSEVDAYNPSTNVWTTIAPLPAARGDLAAAVGNNGIIYAIGGNTNGTDGTTATNEVDAYNPATNFWTAVAPLPASVSYLAATAGTDGTIYAIGGGGNGNGPSSSAVYTYNPATNVWTQKASLPLGRGALAVTAGSDGTIYAISGYNEGYPFGTPEVDSYSPTANTWTQVSNLPYFAYGLAATTGRGGTIYAMGGYTQNFAAENQVDVYTPVISTATTLTSSANPSVYGQSVTFTATVAANAPGAGIPTGTMQFRIDGTTFGSAVTLVNGSATSGATSSLSVAAHTIQVLYSGDISFMASIGTLTQTVTPAALTITANNASKTYGQTASFSSIAFTTTGLVNGDTVGSVTETSTGSGAALKVGTYVIVPSAATFSAGLSSNYTISYANGTLMINAAPLTITANNASKTYGQTATFATTAFTTTGLVNGDTVGGVTETSTGSAATAAVATYPVVPSAATFSAGLSSNYTINYANGTLTVNAAPLTITANNASKTYGQTASFAGTAFTTSGLVNGDTVSSVTETELGAGLTALVSGSPFPITPSAAVGTGLGNYTINYANGTLTVNPAALSITANSTAKTYGQTLTFAGTAFTTSGLVNGDTVTSATETSTGAAATATVAGSPYSIIPSAAVGTGLGNYTISYVNGTLTVNPAALTITANSTAKTYGQTATFAGTAFTTTGLVNGDTVSGVTETSAGAAATATVAGSPYSILPSVAVGTGLGNYTISYLNGTLTVNPATLMITANSTAKTYGQTATFAATAFTTTGLVNGDTVSGVTETSAGAAATTLVSGSPYSITPSAAVGTGLGNYTISYVNGALTVNAAALTITANSTAKTYGQTLTFAGTAFTTSGLINGDTVTSATETSAGAAATATVAGSPYSIIPSAAVGTGLGNYTISYLNGTLTVNPAALTITANSTAKTYGQTVTFAANSFTTTGLVNGDTVTSVTETSTGAAATALVSGSPYSINPSAAIGTGLGNYTISYLNGALMVNPAALTIMANGTAKTYGQTLTFAGTAFATSGLVNGDTVTSVTETTAGAAATATVTGSPYSIIPSAAVGTGLGNYTISYLNGALTVNTAALTITANSTVKTYGQAVTFAGTAFTTSGLVNGDTVTSVTETSTGAAATALVSGSPYSINPSAAVGTGLGNYTISYVNGALTVNTAGLTITANSNSKTYGQTVTFSGTAFTTSGLVNGDMVTSVTETSAGAAATALVSGSPYSITPSAAVGTGLGNYTISYLNGTLTVNTAALTITANSTSKIYGQTATFAGTAFTTGGLVNGDTVTSVTETSAGAAATATVAGSPYGTLPSAAVGTGLGNYTISYLNGTLTVNPAALTITANNASKTYGQAASFAGSAFTTSGLVNADTVGSVTETSAGAAATTLVSGSPYPITPSAAVGTGLGNYTISYLNGTLTVNPAALTITANNASKTYGQAASFAGSAFTTSGLVNADTVGSVTETSAGAAATTLVSGSPYPITPSAAVGTGLGNYTITYVNGTLTVNTAALSITANSTSKTYGQTVTFAGTPFTTSGLVNGDTLTSATETSAGAAGTATVAGSPYSIVPSAAVGTGLGNYTISYLNGALTVSTAAFSITANSTAKTYGQTLTFAGTAFTTSGLVNGDMVTSVTETSAGAAATALVSGSPYSITPSAAVGTGLGNYTINYVNGTLTVNPAALLITANNASKTYGQAASFAGTAFLASGLVNGDTVGGVTETSTGSGPTAVVGTYPIVPSAATFSAGLSNNYTITYANGILTVNPAGLSITVTYTTNPSVYGQPVIFTAAVAANPPDVSTPTGTVQFQIDGTNFGSLVTLAGGNATSGATSALAAGSHSIQAMYSGDANFSPGTGTLTQSVNPAPLAITANDASKTYGQTATFAGTAFTASGLVNGDTVGSVTETSTGAGLTAPVGTDPIVPSTATFPGGQSSNYTITYANGTLTVNQASLAITANNASKTFGQTATFAANAFTSTGLVNGDTVGSVTETSTGSAPTPGVGTYSIVPSAATFSAGLSSNYTINYANGTLSVNPAALAIRANNASKTYGQTASFAATAFTTTGLVNGDTVGSVTETSTGSAATAAVANYPIVPSAATFAAGLSHNYTISYANATLTVNPAALAITANNANKNYGQTATFAATAFTTTGLVNGDTVSSVTEISTGSTATAGVGTDPIVPSSATFSAGLSSNYAISYANGTLTVNPATLSVTASNASKTYGQTATFASTAFTTSGLVNGDKVSGVTETSTGSPATAAVGTYPIVPSSATFSAGLSSNYTINDFIGTLKVNPAALEITANNASKAYGQTATFAATAFTTSGLVNGDTVSSLTETSTGSGATAGVGTDPIVPGAATFSVGLSSNYTITYANGTLTVNPAALAITANNASKIYGQTATFAATAFTTTGLVNGDTVGSVTEISTGSGATAAVGTDPIVPSAATFSVGLSSNYTITYANGTLTINPAALAITANNASKTYGQTASFASTAFTTNGLVNGNTVSSVTETSTGSGPTAAVGTDPIVPSAASFSSGLSSNYTITYANGTLTVNPAALSIRANNASKTYGQTATFAANAFTTTGLVNGDTVSGVTETSTGSAATAGVGTDPIVPGAATFSSGLSSNYTISYAIGTLMVNPAPLSITANDASKTYGQTATFAATAFTTNGLLNGDTVSSLTETSTGSAATAGVGTDPNVPSSATFSVGLSTNYAITYANGTLTVNPAALAITANNASKTYGQTATFAANAFTTNGLVNGDSVTSVTETSTGSGATALVSGSPYSITPSAAVGTGLGNYTIDYVNGTLTVSPAALSITANDASKTYGQTATFAANAFTATGLVNGDTVSSVTETSAGAAAMALVSGSPYSITPSAAIGTGLGNYTISYVNGTLTVNRAALSITANSTAKTYGQTVTFAGTAFTTSGLVNGDTVTSVSESTAGATATATVVGSPYSIIPSAAVGTGLGNYTISYLNGTLTVNPAALSITANSTAKTYGQTVTFAGTAFTTSGLVNGDTVTSATETSAGAAASATVAGSPYSILPSAAVGTGLSNYTISYVNGTLTVSSAALSITANSTAKTYGQTVTFAANAFTTTGLVNGDTVTSVTETSAGAAATALVSGSPDSITPSAAVGTGLGNYTISYLNGTLTVNPAALSITANISSKTYVQTVTFAANAFTTTGLVNGNTVTSATETSAGAAATATVSGSPYSILPSAAVGTGLGNYTISYVNGTLTVNPAPLTITANNASKTYGQTATFAATAFTTTGLVNGDTVSGVTETSTGSVPTAAVGTDPIVPGAATFSAGLSSNYTITYANGTLTVNPAALSIAWPAPAAITYGTALSGTQLDATVSIPGTFVYTPAAGTVLNVGPGQTLSVTFTPKDATDYNTVTTTVAITVLAPPQVVSVSTTQLHKGRVNMGTNAINILFNEPMAASAGSASFYEVAIPTKVRVHKMIVNKYVPVGFTTHSTASNSVSLTLKKPSKLHLTLIVQAGAAAANGLTLGQVYMHVVQ